MSMVVDNSVVLAWCLADESNEVADRALSHVTEHGAVVPGIWWYELRNALVVNERRGRLTVSDTQASLSDLQNLRITIDREHDQTMLLDLTRRHELSVYDASYLEVAHRLGLKLCTLDTKLQRAAKRASVGVWTG